MAMRGTLGNDSAAPGPIGLSYLFHRMVHPFRESVVKRALTFRDRVSANARDTLSRSVSKSVAVAGFRNAGLAPAARLLDPLMNEVMINSELAAAVLRVWAESHEELRELVSSHLKTRDIAVQDFDFPGHTIRFPDDDRPLVEAFDAFEDFPTEAHEDEVTLLIELLTGTVVMCRDPEDDGHDDETPLSTMLEDTLEILTILPPDAPEWEVLIPDFAAKVTALLESKETERKLSTILDNLLAEICEQYAELALFFEWNTSRWFAGNVLTGVELRQPYDLAVQLQELLSQYAPIQERAQSAAEEIRRTGRIVELLPRIIGAGASLDDLMKQDGSPDEPRPGDGGAGDGSDDEGSDDDGPEPARLPGGSPDAGPAANIPAPEISPSAPETGPSAEFPGIPEPPKPAAAGDGRPPEGRYPGARQPEAPNPGDRFTEVPPCQIEDYLLLRLENLDLEKETDDLEKEVQSLKEQLFESRSRGEGLRQALVGQGLPPAGTGDNGPAIAVPGEEDGEIEDVNSAVELAKARFAGQMLFRFNSESTIEDSSFKWPERVWRALEWLGTSYYESRVGLATNPDLDGSCRLASGMWYKTSQHDTTMTAYRNSYTTRVDGRLIWLREHIGKGTGFDPRRTIRIGFDWDRTLQKVIIGYLGQHQRTAAS